MSIKTRTKIMAGNLRCDGKIKRILPESEVITLKSCFELLEENFPNTPSIAELNNQCHCPHALSYGFSYYCSNEGKIKEHIKENLPG